MELERVSTITDTDDPAFTKRLKKYPWLKSIKAPFCAYINGTCGSGKTSCIMSLLTGAYKDYFNLILVYVMTLDSNSLFESLHSKKTEVVVTNSYSNEGLLEFYKEFERLNNDLRDHGKKTKRALVIIDDFITDPMVSKRGGKASAIDTIITTFRHAGVSLMVTSQKWTAGSMNLRAINPTNIIVTGLTNKDLEIFCQEHSSEYVSDRDLENLYKTIRKRGFGNFLTIDRRAPPKLRYGLNFKPIIFDYDESSDGE